MKVCSNQLQLAVAVGRRFKCSKFKVQKYKVQKRKLAVTSGSGQEGEFTSSMGSIKQDLYSSIGRDTQGLLQNLLGIALISKRIKGID